MNFTGIITTQQNGLNCGGLGELQKARPSHYHGFSFGNSMNHLSQNKQNLLCNEINKSFPLFLPDKCTKCQLIFMSEKCANEKSQLNE